ncbi:hypothetical protein BH20ACI4_BH20ACI4_21490 [soil metagenome]
MKQFLFIALILFSFNFTFAQVRTEVPITQAEYVKMLYEAEKSPSAKQALIDAIRQRGIGFELTPGLRSLTTTKSRNDADLKRTLEEAERRRQNPSAAKLPSEEEARELIEKARTNTLESVEEMPDFVVKQVINRGIGYAGTGNFRNRDRLVVAVSYRSSGQEEYKVLSVNGVLQNNPDSKQSYAQTGGTSSTGEFVTVLAKIFKKESDTKFEIVDTDTIRGRRTVAFDYSIERDKAKQQITFFAYYDDSVITGMKGRIWIDRENFRVLRVETEATDIPESFPIRSAKRVIDYDWVNISEQRYLLPLLSDVRLTARQSKETYETRNIIKFKDYQKFGTDVIVLEDDTEEVIEDEVKPDQ